MHTTGDFDVHYGCSHGPLTTLTLIILNVNNLEQTIVQSTIRRVSLDNSVFTARPSDGRGLHQSTKVSHGRLQSDHSCILRSRSEHTKG